MQNDGFQEIALTHQIFITDDRKAPRHLPEVLERNRMSLKRTYPAATYRMWDEAALRDMIGAHFEPAVLQAFETLQPYAYKSDLARYCLLYIQGGLYTDLATRHVHPLRPPPHAGIAAFRDIDFLSPSWTAVSNSVLWARPNRREFRTAIDMILENCRTRFYGTNALYPTGPVLLGRALVAAMAEQQQSAEADDQWIGHSSCLTPGKEQANVCFVAPDFSLTAIRIKSIGGDLTHLGAVGTNNYNDFWRRRTVYAERRRTWNFDDPDIHLLGVKRSATGISIPFGFSGRAIYGPYTKLEQGSYLLEVHFASVRPQGEVLVRVTADCHATVLHEHQQAIVGGENLIGVPFVVPTTAFDIEFTMHFFGDCEGEIRQLSVQPIEDRAIPDQRD